MMIVRQFVKVINPGEGVRIIDTQGDEHSKVLEGKVTVDNNLDFEDISDSEWYEKVYSNFHITGISVGNVFIKPIDKENDQIIPVYEVCVR